MRYEHRMPFGAELRDDGVAFRLWAPSRARVSVFVDGVERELEPQAGGWFERTVLRGARRLALCVRVSRRDLRVPDLASRFQPGGVHEPSLVVDPHAYALARSWLARPAVARAGALRTARRNVHPRRYLRCGEGRLDDLAGSA